MKTLLFATILLFAGISFGGGSEVPWPLSSEEPVFLENIVGYWKSDALDEEHTYYHFYFNKVGPRPSCPYVIGVDEINSVTREVTNRGESSYCLVHPRKLSFVMYGASGQSSHVLNFVGVKKENPADLTMGAQFIGLSVFGDAARLVPIEHTLLHKFIP